MPQAADASIDRPGLGLDADASSAEYQVTADPDPVELTAAPAKPSPDAAQRSPRQGSRASDSGRSLRETFNQISRDVP
jgi:hypothetical protein